MLLIVISELEEDLHQSITPLLPAHRYRVPHARQREDGEGDVVASTDGKAQKQNCVV